MQPISTFTRGVLTLLATIAIAACSSGGSTGFPSAPPSAASASVSPSAVPSPASASTDAISIKGFAFAPDGLTVPVGTTVMWTNNEDSLHTVTSGTPEAPSGLFDSGEIDTGVDFAFTFTEQGTYPFFCARHDFMHGVVTVRP